MRAISSFLRGVSPTSHRRSAQEFTAAIILDGQKIPVTETARDCTIPPSVKLLLHFYFKIETRRKLSPTYRWVPGTTGNRWIKPALPERPDETFVGRRR